MVSARRDKDCIPTVYTHGSKQKPKPHWNQGWKIQFIQMNPHCALPFGSLRTRHWLPRRERLMCFCLNLNFIFIIIRQWDAVSGTLGLRVHQMLRHDLNFGDRWDNNYHSPIESHLPVWYADTKCISCSRRKHFSRTDLVRGRPGLERWLTGTCVMHVFRWLPYSI